MSWSRLNCLIAAIVTAFLVSPGDAGPRPPTATPGTAADTTPSSPVFFFGTVVSTQAGCLEVELVVPEVSDLDAAISPPLIEVLPGRGLAGPTVDVAIDAFTVVAAGNGTLAGLVAGTPVVVGGKLAGGVLQGHFVLDPNQMLQPPAAAAAGPAGSMTWEMGPPGAWPPPTDTVLAPPSSASDPMALEFPGSFGGPSWIGDTGNLDIPLWILPWVELDRIVMTVGLGGAEYNFPFTLEADGAGALVVEEDGAVVLNVEPQSRDPFTYYWAFGFNIAFHMKVCWFWLCDTYVYDFNLASTINQTQEPAPMPGETLDVEPLACASVDVSLGFLELLGVQFCQEQVFTGDPFISNVELENTTGQSVYGYRQFDGTTPVVLPVTPYTNPVNVVMDDFVYSPYLEMGYYVRVYLFDWTIYQFPTIPVTDGWISLIPTDEPDCDHSWGTIVTCGDQQPSSATMTLPVVPVVTTLEAWPNPARLGDMVTLQALVRGANGPGPSPAEVTFRSGEDVLAVVPIDSQDLATFEISSLDVCRHDITAEYVGYDTGGNAYPTQRAVTQLVTGNEQQVRLAGYWHHQCSGNGDTEVPETEMLCCLALCDAMSSVFCEQRNVLDLEAAYDVLDLAHNEGSELEKLDRQLLVAWLNFATGALVYDQLLDTTGDLLPDTSFGDIMATAEAVRLDPDATDSELQEQTRIVHTAMAGAM